jgi:hypothetical protein
MWILFKKPGPTPKTPCHIITAEITQMKVVKNQTIYSGNETSKCTLWAEQVLNFKTGDTVTTAF